MTGERRLNCDFGSLKVTNFSDHHHIRVLTKERTKHLGERIAHLRINWHLDNAIHIVFHRLLSREKLRINLVDASKNGVKRSCLT